MSYECRLEQCCMPIDQTHKTCPAYMLLVPNDMIKCRSIMSSVHFQNAAAAEHLPKAKVARWQLVSGPLTRGVANKVSATAVEKNYWTVENCGRKEQAGVETHVCAAVSAANSCVLNLGRSTKHVKDAENTERNMWYINIYVIYVLVKTFHTHFIINRAQYSYIML